MANEMPSGANQVARAICGKPESLPFDECLQEQKQSVKICQSGGMCRIKEKTVQRQLHFPSSDN